MKKVITNPPVDPSKKPIGYLTVRRGSYAVIFSYAAGQIKFNLPGKAKVNIDYKPVYLMTWADENVLLIYGDNGELKQFSTFADDKLAATLVLEFNLAKDLF